MAIYANAIDSYVTHGKNTTDQWPDPPDFESITDKVEKRTAKNSYAKTMRGKIEKALSLCYDLTKETVDAIIKVPEIMIYSSLLGSLSKVAR